MKYDIIFFEALGAENHHLDDEIKKAQAKGTLPSNLKYYISTDTLQEYLEKNPGTVLPDIVSTKTHSRLPEEWLSNGRKKSVITRSAGYDQFEHLAARINLASLRKYCVNAVAETAIKLMLCACGNFHQYEKNTATFERNDCISFKELTGLKVTVFGVGNIGRRIYDMCVGLGMDARAVDVRRDELTAEYGDTVRFITKEEAKDSDIVICAMNYTADPASRFYNAGYFSEEYLGAFPKGLVFVNITRGEIAQEAALYILYQKGHVFGIGLDVFSGESGIETVLKGKREAKTADEEGGCFFITSALKRTSNVYVQPHQAFNSDKAALAKAQETIKHLESYYFRGCTRFDSQLPYYQ